MWSIVWLSLKGWIMFFSCSESLSRNSASLLLLWVIQSIHLKVNACFKVLREEFRGFASKVEWCFSGATVSVKVETVLLCWYCESFTVCLGGSMHVSKCYTKHCVAECQWLNGAFLVILWDCKVQQCFSAGTVSHSTYLFERQCMVLSPAWRIWWRSLKDWMVLLWYYVSVKVGTVLLCC